MGGSSQWFSVNSWLTGVFCTAKTFIFSELTSYKNDHSIFEQSLPDYRVDGGEMFWLSMSPQKTVINLPFDLPRFVKNSCLLSVSDVFRV